MSNVKPLNVLAFPLNGVRLIEASAGTGKTFTIAALYVRLILGHGNLEQDFKVPLLPPDILVVTFTDASTKELRDRIRRRLTDAARYFRELPVEPDDFLLDLRAGIDASEWSVCAHRLDTAANWMDEAAIYTIHAWCNRMLKQHAFDSGSLFNQTLNNDDADLLLQAIRDYWRSHFYALSSTECAGLFGVFKSPEALAKKIRSLLAETEALPLDSPLDIGSVFKDWALWALKRESMELSAHQLWRDSQQTITELFAEAAEGEWLSKTNYSTEKLSARLAEMDQWARSSGVLKTSEVAKFSRASLIKSGTGLKKNFLNQADKFALPAFIAIDAFVEHAEREPDLASHIIPHAIQWIRQRYASEKRRLAQMTYDDMLTNLDQALQGERGEQLAEVIRAQYPVAMIDEFQDTDPVQYRIFSTIYPASETETLACFMIGDPKQAIYSFRGADIFTYLKAHQATTGHHYTLDTNYRSTERLVNAVNQMFLQADQRPTSLGAFQFKAGDFNPLPFVKVNAKGLTKQWWVNGESRTPLTAWFLNSDTPVSFAEYQNQLAEVTASEIVSLLNSAQHEKTGFMAKDGTLDALKPGDIAILVRTGQEAKVMRKALAKRGLPNVYLSERDSIYATHEAGDMLIWLKAMADPRSEVKVRAAISTGTFAYTYQQLHHFTVDEYRWEQHLERFMLYQQRWQMNGILPALRQLISDYQLHQQTADFHATERSLTNLLHLAELLQQASAKLDGEQALIRHLAEAIADESDLSSDDLILRLESDANLIQIITIHKSKGLEYPLVFLPFIASFREPKGEFYRFHDNNKNRCIDLEKHESSKAAANTERLQEDLRLLYVALTRAQYACWLGLAPVKFANASVCQLDKSAIGYLLNWQAQDPSNVLAAKLQAMKGACDEIAVAVLPVANDEAYRCTKEIPALQNVAVARTQIADNWWIASYSALTIGAHYSTDSLAAYFEPESSQDTTYTDEAEAEASHASQALQISSLHQLPKGAAPGLLVHDLLETIGRAGFSNSAADRHKKQQAISLFFNHGIWVDQYAVLESALDNWLSMPLLSEDTHCCLASLEPSDYQVEMEFLIGVDERNGVDVQQLDALVSRSTFAGYSRPAVLPNQLTGLLKGYIDLVFVHNQRYYIADYKFNHLGNHLSDYAPDKLRDAMLSKRYDLQMVLYVLALHRLLKNRLGQRYDYDQHIGGGVYLFLRGVEHESHGRLFERPDRSLIETLDRMFLGASV